MGDQLWATETSWTFADFYRAAECSVEDQLSATRRLSHAPRTGHWAKLTATESTTIPEQLLPHRALSRIFKRCRCSAEEKTPLIAQSKHTRQMKDSRWSEKVSRFQLLCSVKSLGKRSPASLSVWKTRSVLGYILKDFRGWPKLWDVGQQIIKIKEWGSGQLLTGMNRKAATHKQFLLPWFTFSNTSCQSWWGGRQVSEEFVNPKT